MNYSTLNFTPRVIEYKYNSYTPHVSTEDLVNEYMQKALAEMELKKQSSSEKNEVHVLSKMIPKKTKKERDNRWDYIVDNLDDFIDEIINPKMTVDDFMIDRDRV